MPGKLRTGFFLEIDFSLNKTLHRHWIMCQVLAATTFQMRKNLTHYGLNSGKRPPPISDDLNWLDMRGRLLEVRLQFDIQIIATALDEMANLFWSNNRKMTYLGYSM